MAATAVRYLRSVGAPTATEPFDACALVESVAASAADLARDKKLELVVDVPPAATFVVADGARIDQILTNLVINSVRYTETGQVRIGLRRYALEERVLEFVVADTGPGVPDEMLPMLLAPDRTISGSARRGEGSGIGLAMTFRIVQLHNGKIDFFSEPGKGTTFVLRFPLEGSSQ